MPGQGLAAQSANATEAKDVVAIQLRAQGIPCNNPTKAVKDLQDSTPDEMTWVIMCKEATYRVKLIPHLGARVGIIEDSGPAGEDLGIKE